MGKKDKKGALKKGKEETQDKDRIAIVNEDKCKPKKCGLEC